MRYEGVDYQKAVGHLGFSFEDNKALDSSLPVLLQVFRGDALHLNFYTTIVLFFCPISSRQYVVSQ